MPERTCREPASAHALEPPPSGPPAVAVAGVVRRFGAVAALDGVDLTVAPGETHALLGPNGAGKTTLLRILSGLTEPHHGRVVLREGAAVGLVPSGDRSFYLRLSGEENLVFFGRLQGLRRRAARERAGELLAQVGLADAARRRVGTYSHGMQKRLSVARALLVEPAVLLVDEATHDLDPDAAATVRAIVSDLAARGTAVLWATQRIEEIRGFADRVTVLAGGAVRFAGPVGELLARAEGRTFVLRLSRRAGPGLPPLALMQAAVGRAATLGAADAAGHLRAELRSGAAIGDVVAALAGAGLAVHDCRRERSEAEDAFLAVARAEAA